MDADREARQPGVTRKRLSLHRAAGVVAVAAVVAAMGYLYWDMFAGVAQRNSRADVKSVSAAPTADGSLVYASHCARCHGANLEGQPNWRERLPSGRMPAPAHDDSGHTWHHPDNVLFGIVRDGLVPGKYAPPGYQSDMPAFGPVLTDDEIRAVLAYVESRWSPKVREFRTQLRDQASK